jgi:pyrroline-5-carboxylate reductase
LGDWIWEILPDDMNVDEADRKENLANVSTKGGITQAMTAALQGGEPFGEALMRGLERCREITEEIRASVIGSKKHAV